MSWYDLNDSEDLFLKNQSEDGNLELPDKLYKKFQEKNYQTINSIKEIGLPKPGEQLRLITMKSFNTISFINHIASKEVIQHLVLVIFAINKEAVKCLLDLISEGKILKIECIVSSIRNAGYSIKSQAVEILKQNNIPITFVNSHAKISAIKTKNNNYVIEGSGNFSYNGRIEQYIIDNDKALFKFTLLWIKEMRNLMKSKKDYLEVNVK